MKSKIKQSKKHKSICKILNYKYLLILASTITGFVPVSLLRFWLVFLYVLQGPKNKNVCGN